MELSKSSIRSMADHNLRKETIDFLRKALDEKILEINARVFEVSRILDFVTSEQDIEDIRSIIETSNTNPAKIEYGDFQTPHKLSEIVCQNLKNDHCSPSVVFEPTCGKGSFILSALKTFDGCKKIVGLEIYKPYLLEAKLNVLDYMLTEHSGDKPTINLIHQNIFDADFAQYFSESDGEILIMGNPPWVTNSVLGVLESENLPLKSNFKNLNGFDAITGKSNFDISEFILIQLISYFQRFRGCISILVKNAVIKNIIHEQRKSNYQLGNMQMQKFNAKKEFNVSVEASNFYGILNAKPEYTCETIELYSGQECNTFGWVHDKFVSNIDDYESTDKFDGVSPLVWRSGIKHDCSKVFEIWSENGGFENKFGEHFQLESDIVYPLLKSSDLKGGIINSSRKSVIATQRKIGQDTSYIKGRLPQTYQYLESHAKLINKRGSSIYKGKPPFSIFGVGEYSYKPYKVAISGLYKRSVFSLVMPSCTTGQSILLDDTCYFLSFDHFTEAYLTYKMLNHTSVQKFLASIVFLDAKRPYSKDVLMRLSLEKIHSSLNFSDFDFSDADSVGQKVSKVDWDNYLLFSDVNMTGQKTLFG